VAKDQVLPKTNIPKKSQETHRIPRLKVYCRVALRSPKHKSFPVPKSIHPLNLAAQVGGVSDFAVDSCRYMMPMNRYISLGLRSH